MSLGCGLVAYFSRSTSPGFRIMTFVFIGTGCGIWFPAGVVGGLSSLPSKSGPEFIAMFLWCRALGQAITLSTGSTVFANRMLILLRESGNSALVQKAIELSRNVNSLVQQLRTLPDSDATKLAIRLSLLESFYNIFYAALAGAALAFILSIFLRSTSLDQAREAEQKMVQRLQQADEETATGATANVVSD